MPGCPPPGAAATRVRQPVSVRTAKEPRRSSGQGIRSISPLGETEGWITYDFPPEVLAGPMRKRGFRGQKQKWFAFRFEGQDSEVDLDSHGPREFDVWKWADYDEVLSLVVPFKRDAYVQVLAAFRHLAG